MIFQQIILFCSVTATVLSINNILSCTFRAISCYLPFHKFIGNEDFDEVSKFHPNPVI
jgi:hypothetical protein